MLKGNCDDKTRFYESGFDDVEENELIKRIELWEQMVEPDLWETESGLIVNTAALNARAPYYEVIRIPTLPPSAH